MQRTAAVVQLAAATIASEAVDFQVIPGKYGFIAQLNEGRHLKKRPTEFRVDKVLQAFDKNKFNFTKIGQEEALFQFQPSSEGNVSRFSPNAPVDAESSPSIVAINALGEVSSEVLETQGKEDYEENAWRLLAEVSLS